MPAPKQPDDRQFRVGEEIRVNLHHGKIEEAVICAVIQDADGINYRWMLVGLDLRALIDTIASRSGRLGGGLRKATR